MMSQSDLVIGPTGPVMPDSAAVLEAVQGDWRAALGDNLNVNPATPQGQLMASQAAARRVERSQFPPRVPVVPYWVSSLLSRSAAVR